VRRNPCLDDLIITLGKGLQLGRRSTDRWRWGLVHRRFHLT
jgi:hypothetical protein